MLKYILVIVISLGFISPAFSSIAVASGAECTRSGCPACEECVGEYGYEECQPIQCETCEACNPSTNACECFTNNDGTPVGVFEPWDNYGACTSFEKHRCNDFFTGPRWVCNSLIKDFCRACDDIGCVGPFTNGD